jgi:hypothetical protein
MVTRRNYVALAALAILTTLSSSLGTPAAEPLQRGRRATRSGPRRVAGTEARPLPVLWREPQRVRELDLVGGAGGREHAPRPPFRFVEEDTDGSNPKIDVTDASGRKWGVKWGTEVNAETFATRIAWAAGYFVEPAYFVASGRVLGVDRDRLKRAKKYVEDDGSFRDARFELKAGALKKYKDEESWAWNSNPFVGTRELNGLKILVMLTSNWDSKDVRDVSRGSNTAVYVVQTDAGVEARYLLTDWGGSMGKWGNYFSREKWDADGFAKQTPDFVKGVEGGYVKWGYAGQRTDDIRDGIRVSDARWMANIVGRLSDAQIRDALRASGATASEVDEFSRALRNRITQLQRIR